MTWFCILPIDLWRYDPPPQRSLHNVYRAPRFPSSKSHWRLGDGCEIAIQSSTIMSTSVVDYAGAGVKNYDTNGTSRWQLRIMQNPEGEEASKKEERWVLWTKEVFLTSCWCLRGRRVLRRFAILVPLIQISTKTDLHYKPNAGKLLGQAKDSVKY